MKLHHNKRLDGNVNCQVIPIINTFASTFIINIIIFSNSKKLWKETEKSL